MRNFNPNRELNKIKYRKRNKVIFTIIFSIVLVTIGYSFALYQVRHSKRIIYTTVSDFKNNKDIILSVFFDDKKQNSFPARGLGYIYDKIECDNGSTGEFSIGKWQLTMYTSGPDKCDVYFKKVYKDESGANYPELYEGLIPIRYDENGKM